MLMKRLPEGHSEPWPPNRETVSDRDGRYNLIGKTVLVVEDELLTGICLRMDAERSGAAVIGPTATLQGTLAAIAGVEIDVAILDVKLADAEVFPVADQLRDAGVPMIFHTGHGRESMLKKRYPDCHVFTKATASVSLLKAAGALLIDHDEGLRAASG